MSCTHPRNPLRVCCALIEREAVIRGGEERGPSSEAVSYTEILAAQRPAHKSLGGKWEFPGGKIEPGEDPAGALIREVREELDCEVRIVEPLSSVRHVYSEDFTIHLFPFRCRFAGPESEPRALEHQALLWCQPSHLPGLDWAEADLPIIREYLERFESRVPSVR